MHWAYLRAPTPAGRKGQPPVELGLVFLLMGTPDTVEGSTNQKPRDSEAHVGHGCRKAHAAYVLRLLSKLFQQQLHPWGSRASCVEDHREEVPVLEVLDAMLIGIAL